MEYNMGHLPLNGLLIFPSDFGCWVIVVMKETIAGSGEKLGLLSGRRFRKFHRDRSIATLHLNFS
jgi:hypothetical protein